MTEDATESPEPLVTFVTDGAYFRSHPLPSERIAQVNEIISQDHLPADRQPKPFHLEYEITSHS